MRVLLVDDHALFLEGLTNLLTSRGVEVVGTAGDGLEALVKVRSAKPDIVLMDVRMPKCDGLQATRMIKAEFRDVKVIMMTVSDEDEDLIGAIKSGASGYLLKSADAREFFEALDRASRGEAVLSDGLTDRVFKAIKREGMPSSDLLKEGLCAPSGLTPRQLEVLTLATQGLTHGQIGTALCLSEHTVKYHFRRILGELGLENRAQAISYAWQAGIVDRA